jgi:regulator of replication initiation timing
VRGTARRAWFLALLALAATAHAQEFYPVSFTVSAGEPERGKPLTLWVRVSATRRVEVMVEVITYVPGRGWGEWRELWEGVLLAGETKLLSHTEYIPEDAKPGSVIAWVRVHFTADDFYTYMGGRYYYVPYGEVRVLGVLPDPQVDALKRQVEQLRANYTALQLDYRNLRTSYEALQKSYAGLEEANAQLKKRLGELEASNANLQRELSAVRSERDRLQGELRAWTTTAVVAGLAGLAAGEPSPASGGSPASPSASG